MVLAISKVNEQELYLAVFDFTVDKLDKYFSSAIF